MSLHVAPTESGIVRVFSLSMPDDAAKALAQAKDPRVLGLDTLDPNFVEVFPLSDLQELGLAGYLETGCGIPSADLTQDKAKLNQLDGWVLIVFSRAFQGRAAELVPAPELTLIGTYHEPGVDWSATQTLTSAAATTPAKPTRKPPSDAAMSGRIATAALLVIFALTGLMIWVAS